MKSSKISFRTEVNTSSFPFRLGYRTPTMFCGSCFTENIGGIMQSLKMPVMVNPNGVVYNPLSVAKVIRNILSGKEYSSVDLSYRNGIWFSYDHYTRFSSESKEECLSRINESNRKAYEFVREAKFFAITLGTARVYKLVNSGEVVANCHKVPAKEFTHTLLTVDEIVAEWCGIIDEVLSVKPDAKFIFTVSPIRHWKDGAVGNQLSKSTLILAIHKLIENFPKNVFYFPAYEIMMDDLRDYRFYDTDMLHPSPIAVEYIWQKFSAALIEPEAMKIAESVHNIQQAIGHRPVNPQSESFKRFVEKTLLKIAKIENEYPFLNFEKEKRTISDYLK